ncbi:hypothetical protein B0H13DRAFT_1929169 [Mycena leptocephala]|nr:hypothetical protein B0H13DRAFT_1929169 [Mycena leptocephala]
MCISKIFTEMREEKERKALRARWEDGREWKPGNGKGRGEGEESTSSRRSLLQRRGELAVARAQEEAAPGGIHAHRTVNLSTRGGNIKEKRVDSALSSSSALPASPPPHDAMPRPSPHRKRAK